MNGNLYQKIFNDKVMINGVLRKRALLVDDELYEKVRRPIRIDVFICPMMDVEAKVVNHLINHLDILLIRKRT